MFGNRGMSGPLGVAVRSIDVGHNFGFQQHIEHTKNRKFVAEFAVEQLWEDVAGHLGSIFHADKHRVSVNAGEGLEDAHKVIADDESLHFGGRRRF